MPTWRGTHALRNDTEQYIYIMHLLIELEKNIDDNTIVFVKEHNMSSLQIDFTQFEKIKPFPNIYETYQFLSITDCLITDYSSVMFDYANTGRKIILYAYDEEEYFKDRGMYIDFKTLPFVKCRTTVEVINELSQIDKYVSYEEEINKYISYDKTNTITDLLNLMIENKLSEKLNVIDGTKYRNNKENVLVFTGALLKNGITTALSGILNNVDAEEKNYILTFTAKSVAPNKKTISKLGDFDYFSIQGQVNLLIHEAIISFLYYRLNLHNKYIDNVMKNRYEREIKRIYPYVHFDYVIHYTGYERKFMNLFRFIDAKKMIYVHNNLIKESKTRNNIHLPSLKTAYKEYDKIVIIRESMKEELIFDSNLDIKEKVMLAHNLNNYDLIIENSKQELLFDEDTVCNKELEEVKSILNDKKGNIFIDVARFSVEKGLDNLVSAFEEHYSSCPDDYLIIIGGHGNTYEDLMIQVENSQAKDHIIIIKSLSNPFPVLGKSDAFVLSSHYEGLPMVIMEALILNKPVISTDITGPREFLSQGYGYLVPDSIEGLVKGMKMYTDTKLVDLKPFDYVDFNKKAINEFYSLFD